MIGLGQSTTGGRISRAQTISANVPLTTGLLTTVSTLGLLAPLTYAKTGGNANLTLNTSTGGISATVALSAGATQSLAGTATGADGVVVPFTANLTGQVSVPAAPALTLTPGNNQLTVNITDGSNGGAAITGHTLWLSTTNGFTPGAGNLYGPVSNGTVITGLTNGTTYYGVVIATNSAGSSVNSAQASAAPSAVTLNAPFFDDFTTDGALSSRTGWAVTTNTAQSGQSGVLSTLNGEVRGTNTAVGFGVMGVHDTGAGSGASSAWLQTTSTLFRLGPTGGFIAHATMDPIIGLTALGDGDNVSATFQAIVNGAASARWQATLEVFARSVREHETWDDNGTKRVRFYYGGRQYDYAADTATKGIDIQAALGRGPNGNYGFSATIAASAGEQFCAVNRATDRWIRVTRATAIVTSRRDIFLYGQYGGPEGDVAPTSAEVKVYAYSSATEAVLPAVNGISLTNFTASGGNWEGTIPQFNAGVDYWLEVVWSFKDATNADVFTKYPTHALKEGVIAAWDGQSQVGFLSGPADAIAAPSNALYFQMDTSVVRGKRLVQPQAVNTVYANMTSTLRGFSASVPVQFVSLALGGNPQSARMPETAQFTEAVEGLKAAGGGRPDIIIFAGGTSGEASGTYYNNVLATANGYEDYLGMARGAQLFGISPEGSAFNSGSGIASHRRQAAQLVRDFPNRFKLIAWRNDVQHGYKPGGSPEIDELHYMVFPSSTGYDSGYSAPGTASPTIGQTEWARRMMRGIANALGLTTENYLGPLVTGVSRVDGQTLDWTFDIGSFTGIEVANTAYAGNFSGGLRVSSSMSFGVLIDPLNAVVQSVAGSTAVIRFTYPAGSVAGTVYCAGPDGPSPFNPTLSAPIEQLLKDRASMIRGTKAGMSPVAVQPTYFVGGGGTLDYFTV